MAPLRIVVRPIADPGHEIDVTERLVSAIAEELWRLNGGNQRLNWLEAELHLRRIVGEATEAARNTEFVFVDRDGRIARPRATPASPQIGLRRATRAGGLTAEGVTTRGGARRDAAPAGLPPTALG